MVNLCPRQKLELLPLDNNSIITNSWLAGFSDSDANFTISYILPVGENTNLIKNIKICAHGLDCHKDKIIPIVLILIIAI